MSVKVKLVNMIFYARHGVFPAEKELGQRFEVDLEYQPAIESGSDELEAGIDYAQVYKLVKQIVTEQEYNLIETLAKAIGDGVIAKFPMSQVTVRVRKPQAPLGAPIDYVEVEICREAS